MTIDEHVTTVTGPSQWEGTFNVRCSCGWKKKLIDTRSQAERWAKRHREAEDD